MLLTTSRSILFLNHQFFVQYLDIIFTTSTQNNPGPMFGHILFCLSPTSVAVESRTVLSVVLYSPNHIQTRRHKHTAVPEKALAGFVISTSLSHPDEVWAKFPPPEQWARSQTSPALRMMESGQEKQAAHEIDQKCYILQQSVE